MKVYADQNVVSALWRWHQRPEENAAIRVLKEWTDAGRITLVVSAVHDRERPLPEQFRERHGSHCASRSCLLSYTPFASWGNLWRSVGAT